MTASSIEMQEAILMQKTSQVEDSAELKQEWLVQSKEIDEGIECIAQEILNLEDRLGFLLVEHGQCVPIEYPSGDNEPRERSSLITTLGRIRHKLAENIRRLRNLQERLDI